MDLFRFLRGALGPAATPVSKQDIPEVEAVVEAILPLVERHWKRKINAAVKYLEERLLTYSEALGGESVDVVTGRRALDQELIALLAAFEARLGCPLAPAEAEAVESAATTLLTEGALALGLLLPLGGPRDRLVSQRDLSLLLAGRINEARQQELRGLLRQFLTERSLRDALRQDPRVAPDAAAIRSTSWRRAVRSTLGAYNWSTWGPQTVDAWAYRWHNVGRFRGGLAGGVTRWVARNPMDDRTTKFCRWVHGKVVSGRRIRSKLTAYYAAVAAGDLERMKQIWPLTDPGLDLGRFHRVFYNVGLPPYHFRCRTIVVPA